MADSPPISSTNAAPSAAAESAQDTPAQQSLDPATYTSAPKRSAVCRVDAVREVIWKVPALDLPPIAYLAFISTITAVSMLGITFTAREHFTAWGRKCFLISSGVAALVALTSILFAVAELRAHPPKIPVQQSPVRILADVRVLAVGDKSSEFYGNDKVSLDITPYPGRIEAPAIKQGDTIRVWATWMNQRGIFLPEYIIQVPETEVNAPGHIPPVPPPAEDK